MLHLEDNLMYDYHSLGLCDLYFLALWVCFIYPTIWSLSVIFTYNDTVWSKLRPQSKYKSAWPIFYGLVILFNIFRLFNGLTSVGIMDQCDHQTDLSSLSRSVTYILWSSDLAICLEDYLLYSLGMIDKCLSETDLVKYMLVSDLYFMDHWFCLISFSLTIKYFIIKTWRRPGVLETLWALALVIIVYVWLCKW